MTKPEWRAIVIETQRLAKTGQVVSAIILLRRSTTCNFKQALDAMHKLRDAPTIGGERAS